MSKHRRSVVAGLLVLLCATAFTPANAGVKARAFAVRAKLDKYGLSNHLDCDSGWLDGSRGGSRSNSGSISNGYVLHVDHMESESHGDHCKGRSSSTLDAGWILKGTANEVTWTRIETADEDTCCRAVDVDYLPAVIQGLTFAGRPVVVTGQPNQTIVANGVTLVINERKSDRDDDDHSEHCDDDDDEHYAVHLKFGNGDEVILGMAKFDSEDDCCKPTATRRSTWGMVKAAYR
jgi:hypothetical protein